MSDKMFPTPNHCVLCGAHALYHIGNRCPSRTTEQLKALESDRVDKPTEANDLLTTYPTDNAYHLNQRIGASINAVEAHLQSLLVIVRSLGLDPTQFLLRAAESENRKAQAAYEAKLRGRFECNEDIRRRGDVGYQPDTSAWVNERLDERLKRDAVSRNSDFREQAEDADGVQRVKESKNSVPDE